MVATVTKDRAKGITGIGCGVGGAAGDRWGMVSLA